MEQTKRRRCTVWVFVCTFFLLAACSGGRHRAMLSQLEKLASVWTSPLRHK